MPVAWSYLLFMLILGLVYPSIAMPKLEFASAIFFFRNYLEGGGVLNAGHYWSLSIEEQFYLVWPAVLLWAGKERGKWVLGSVIVTTALIRLTNLSFYDQIWHCFHTEVRADAICIGCLLAIILDKPELRERAIYVVDKLFLPSLAIFTACCLTFQWLPPIAESCAITILLSKSVLEPDSYSSKVLAWKPLAKLGLVSYSIYIWQQFFLDGLGPAINILLDLAFPIVVILSYRFIEKPFLVFGRQLTQEPSLSVIESHPGPGGEVSAAVQLRENAADGRG